MVVLVVVEVVLVVVEVVVVEVAVAVVVVVVEFMRVRCLLEMKSAYTCPGHILDYIIV